MIRVTPPKTMTTTTETGHRQTRRRKVATATDTPDTLSITSIEAAIDLIDQQSPYESDGKWLESLTVDVATLIKDWDIRACYAWGDWPDRQELLPYSSAKDIGIDAVGVRRDGSYIAIQCKARKLDEYGNGTNIAKHEIDSFVSASDNSVWAERWLVTNGNNPPGKNAISTMESCEPPVKLLHIRHDLVAQRAYETQSSGANASKDEMQAEAVSVSVKILREHYDSTSNGAPRGQARGKIILPCGTGKTRISLRIVEELTSDGDISVVLCPSIALVSQIRREYLQHTNRQLNALAVCSDQTAGNPPRDAVRPISG